MSVPPYRDAKRARTIAPDNDQVTAVELEKQAAIVRDYLTARVQFANPDDSWLIATWIIGARMYEELPALTRLFIRSAIPGSGKSLLQHLIALLTDGKNYSQVTGPVLIRALEENKRTICIGEIGRLRKQMGSEWYGIESSLNEGMTNYGSQVPRLDSRNRTVEFKSYFPVVMSGLKNDPFETDTNMRLTEIWLTRTDAEFWYESTDSRTTSETDANIIARTLEPAIRNAVPQIISALKNYVIVNGVLLANRDAEQWQSLFAIASVLGSEWQRHIQSAADERVITDQSENIQPDNGIRAMIWEALATGQLAPRNYQNPRDVDGLEKKLLQHTSLTMNDIGYKTTDLLTTGEPKIRGGFKNLSVRIDETKRIFELRWYNDPKAGYTEQIAKHIAWANNQRTPLDRNQFLKELRDAGMLRAQTGGYTVKGRVLREDKGQEHMIVISLGNDRRIGWATDATDPINNPDGE